MGNTLRETVSEKRLKQSLKKKIPDWKMQSNNLYLQQPHNKLYVYEERFVHIEAHILLLHTK